jgi:2-iminobutanoate/2-iminopropanoate deaminase
MAAPGPRAATRHLDEIYEIYPADEHATRPLGLRVGELVTAGRIDPADPVTGEVPEGIEAQVAAVYQKMAELMHGAGGSLDNVAKVSAFITTIEHRELVNGQLWEELFPERMDRPAYKVILGDLEPGHLVEIEVLGVLGGRRQRYDLPGIPARDPTITIGEMILSSRCHGIDGTTGELVEGGLRAEARRTFQTLRELVVVAGGEVGDIVQLNAYGKQPSYGPVVREVFEEMFADCDPLPRLNTLVNYITPRFEVSIEMIAVRGGGR